MEWIQFDWSTAERMTLERYGSIDTRHADQIYHETRGRLMNRALGLFGLQVREFGKVLNLADDYGASARTKDRLIAGHLGNLGCA